MNDVVKSYLNCLEHELMEFNAPDSIKEPYLCMNIEKSGINLPSYTTPKPLYSYFMILKLS